ncbi:hypothetical protein A6K26_004140 [Gammaproteobacteria bacterium 2W06]|nr:hypothetical protein A6K26_004140 [Gammaproteobacteria bacterium 2W06]
MQFAGPRVTGAHPGDRLPLGDRGALVHQQGAIVAIGGQVARIVLDDHQIAVAGQSITTVDHFAGGGGKHRAARIGRDPDAPLAR